MEATIKSLVEQAKCRKGQAAGTTKKGAYWLVCDPIKIRRSGGDGIGQSGADVTWWLEIRHYRGGEVAATIHRHAWHQNGSWSGAGDRYFGMPEIPLAGSVEAVVVLLKGGVTGQDGEHETCYSDRCENEITSALTALGLPLAEPSPDEIA